MNIWIQQKSVFEANIPAADNFNNSAGDNADNSIDSSFSDLYKSSGSESSGKQLCLTF